MAKKGGVKENCLKHIITDFAIEIGFTATKERYNKAWHKLGCRINKIGLFSK